MIRHDLYVSFPRLGEVLQRSFSAVIRSREFKLPGCLALGLEVCDLISSSSMGNLESVLPERRSLRELRREHRQSFAAAIARQRTDGTETAVRDESLQLAGHGLRVFVRKRPLSEREGADLDVVWAGDSTVRVHRCLSRLDDHHLYLETRTFRCDRAFGEVSTNQEVCGTLRTVLTPHSGRSSVVILFGATGTGETRS